MPKSVELKKEIKSYTWYRLIDVKTNQVVCSSTNEGTIRAYLSLHREDVTLEVKCTE
jgi:hypothetical protein